MEDSISVLIVDDSKAFCHLTRILLELSGGITVVGEAGDGAQAIEKARELQPQVILLDVMMPNVDGLEALPQIVKLCPESRVVMLSACGHAELVLESLEKGAWCYLVKGDCDVVEAIRAVARGEMRQSLDVLVAERDSDVANPVESCVEHVQSAVGS